MHILRKDGGISSMKKFVLTILLASPGSSSNAQEKPEL